MRFVQKWSYSCANHLTSVTNENHQRRSVYYYGFYILIGGLVKSVILLSAAALLGILLPTLVVVFTFGSLRMFAGGYHMDTYNKCLFVSMALFLLAASVSKYTSSYWNVSGLTVVVTVTVISGLYSLIRYSPKDTPNKLITDTQKAKKLKVQSIVYFLILVAVDIALIHYKMETYALCICFSILQELFSITPTGHNFFDFIKDKIGSKRIKQKQA